MHRGTRTDWIARLATLVFETSLVDGCGTVNKASDWLKGSDSNDAGEAVILGAPEADDYLRDLYMLTAGDTYKQADIFDDAESAARLTPGPSTNLRYGLVLATPGHPKSDPARAQGVLRDVLAQSELLTMSEIALATVRLRNSERLVGATSETARLRDTTSRAARAQEQTANERISSLETDNRRLRAELEDAEQKLEAITSIERSIRERE